MHRADASENNLAWYCRVMDAHGLAYACDADLWALARDRAPPYYSDIVTRVAGDPERQLAAIDAIVAERRPHPLGVADCAAALDVAAMAALGFRILFDAEWFGVDDAVKPERETALRFERVTTAPELADWEARWRQWSPSPAGRVFPPAVLQHADNAFWTLRDREHAVGGAITHVDRHGIGLSNVFVGTEPARAGVLRDAVRHAMALTDDRPVVGYGDATDLDDLAPLTVSPLGRHRIWLHQ
ncbi:MAG: hypothetical protein AAGA11_07960 [Pseudomonadota bacterium]